MPFPVPGAAWPRVPFPVPFLLPWPRLPGEPFLLPAGLAGQTRSAEAGRSRGSSSCQKQKMLSSPGPFQHSKPCHGSLPHSGASSISQTPPHGWCCWDAGSTALPPALAQPCQQPALSRSARCSPARTALLTQTQPLPMPCSPSSLVCGSVPLSWSTSSMVPGSLCGLSLQRNTSGCHTTNDTVPNALSTPNVLREMLPGR